MIKRTDVKWIALLMVTTLCQPVMSQVKPAGKQGKILIVVSSYGKDAGKTRPGYEFDEFSQAYLIFRQNDFEVEVASPKGGPVKPDEFNGEKPYNKIVIQDKEAMAMLAATKATVSLDPLDYRAVYIVGGKGAMFDLVCDLSLQDFIAALAKRRDNFIAAVCHGPAALVNIKDSTGRYLLQDHNVTGFSNEEEEMFGKKWVKEFPFLLESKLEQRKAVYSNEPVMLPHVIISGNIITGQNPYSTTALAEALVKALGKTPVPRQLFKDENSLQLVKRALAGEASWAGRELQDNKDAYDIELIAVYGYYRLIDEKASREDLQAGLMIAELARPHYRFNERLWFEMAKAYSTLDEKKTALSLLKEIVSRKPDFTKAAELLKSIE